MVQKNTKIAVGVGAGVAALAAAAAGAYFFTGARGKRNRAKVTQWADAAKKDVVKQLRTAKKVSKETYNQAVDTVLKQYKQLKKVSPEEVAALAGELKNHWEAISKEMQAAAHTVTVQAKKAVARAIPVKKTAAKKAAAKKPAQKGKK